MSNNFLNDVIKYKRAVIRRDKRAEPLAVLKKMIKKLPAPRKLSESLLKGSGIIAEIKRRSPSIKSFPNAADIVKLAQEYKKNGASGISVLTDAKYFGGSPDDMRMVKRRAKMPVLRKDFIIDEYQIYQSRVYGADAVLLIASILDDNLLVRFHKIVTALGMEALIEVHDEAEMMAVTSRFLPKDGVIIGINNRDLRTLKMDMDTAVRLLWMVPMPMTRIVESGIKTRQQIKQLFRLGADGFLIGGTLLKSPSPGKRLRQLIYGKS
ncbi:MAG: indole-3-glycerol phosphate synthase TrpC [Planctomycetes bacterium]|nr:indole-3-glycerol phosphate synthase TrpC [Planctomycetota bacterium]